MGELGKNRRGFERIRKNLRKSGRIQENMSESTIPREYEKIREG